MQCIYLLWIVVVYIVGCMHDHAHASVPHECPNVLYVHIGESTHAYVQYNIVFVYVSELLCHAYVSYCECCAVLV